MASTAVASMTTRAPQLHRRLIYARLMNGLDYRRDGFIFSRGDMAREIEGDDPVEVLRLALGPCWLVRELDPGEVRVEREASVERARAAVEAAASRESA